MSNFGPDDMRAQFCRADFYTMLEDGIRQAGGDSDMVHKGFKLTDKKLSDVVDLLAQNGLRIVYMPEKHIDSFTKLL